MSCKNLDSRPEKNKNKQKENSKSWYENETCKADSSLQNTSLKLNERNLEKIHKTSTDRIPKINIAVKEKKVQIMEKNSVNQKDIQCGQPSSRPATPQADRWENSTDFV